jgi:hypothetical protein
MTASAAEKISRALKARVDQWRERAENIETRLAEGALDELSWTRLRGRQVALRECADAVERELANLVAEHPADTEPTGDEREALILAIGYAMNRTRPTMTLRAQCEVIADHLLAWTPPRPTMTAPVVLDGDPYTLARWVEATECEDVACHDDHPHLVAVETPTATAPSEARLRRGLERLWVYAAASEARDDEVDLLRMDRDLIAAALAARSSQPAGEVEWGRAFRRADGSLHVDDDDGAFRDADDVARFVRPGNPESPYDLIVRREVGPWTEVEP